MKRQQRGITRPRLAAGLMALALVAAACGASDDTADQQPAAPQPAPSPAPDDQAVPDKCLEGETVVAVVGYNPGGGYDVYMRLFVPFLAEELGATVVVENQPGAGSLVAQNIIHTGTPDGKRFMIMNGVGAASASLGGGDGADFPVDDFTYLGRITAQPRVLVTAPDGAYQSFEDILAGWEGFRAGTSGPGASDWSDLQVIREAFGIPFTTISGFSGSQENALALQRGDTDAMTGDIDGRLIAIDAGDQRPVLVIGAERDPAFPDVPTILEFDLDADARALAEAYVAILELGRPMIAPPGMDAELAECLRGAFARALNNPELASEADAQGFPIRALDGLQAQALAEAIENDSPPIFRDLMAEALG